MHMDSDKQATAAGNCKFGQLVVGRVVVSTGAGCILLLAGYNSAGRM